MKPLTLVISFLPWILFGILAGHSLIGLEEALVVSLILTLLVGYKDLAHRIISQWITLIFFALN
jgi:hypothetical protein